MKTERRQELKSNDLSAWLMDANDWAKNHSARIGTVVVVAAVIILAYVVVKRSRASAADAAWQQINELQFTPELADESFQTLDSVIASASDRHLKLKALLRKGLHALSLAEDKDGLFKPEYLDKAEEAYQAILKEFSENMPARADALRALAVIEESRFAVDRDMAHRPKCEQYLNQLVNDPEFRETTFQTSAARELAELDQRFQVIELAEPAPLPPSVIAPNVKLESDQPLNLNIKAAPSNPQPAPTNQTAADKPAKTTKPPGQTTPPAGQSAPPKETEGGGGDR